MQPVKFGDDGGVWIRRHTPRVVHAMTLVAGGAVAGLAYEIVSVSHYKQPSWPILTNPNIVQRPLDIARKAVHLDRLNVHGHHSVTKTLLAHLGNEGLASFFKDPTASPHNSTSQVTRPKLHAFLRTLGRVGPWGIGFLVWEAFGPGIS